MRGWRAGSTHYFRRTVLLLAFAIYAGPTVNLYQGPTVTYHGSERMGTGERRRGQYGQVLSYLGQKNFDVLSNASLEKLGRVKWAPLSANNPDRGLFFTRRNAIGIRPGQDVDTGRVAMHEALHALDPRGDLDEVERAAMTLPVSFGIPRDRRELYPMVAQYVGFDPSAIYEFAGPTFGEYYRGVFRTPPPW